MANFLKNEKDIIDWLKKYHVNNFTLVQDNHYGFVVDVAGELALSALALKEVPVKFRRVEGDVDCFWNELTHLEWCPEIVEGSFNAIHNKITSLKGAPQSVKRSFRIGQNQLTSLEFAPTRVGFNFDCRDNLLENLQYCPQIVGFSFDCSNNNLKTLEFLPARVDHDFVCSNNKDLGKYQNLNDLKTIKKWVAIENEKNNLSEALRQNLSQIVPQINKEVHKI